MVKTGEVEEQAQSRVKKSDSNTNNLVPKTMFRISTMNDVCSYGVKSESNVGK